MTASPVKAAHDAIGGMPTVREDLATQAPFCTDADEAVMKFHYPFSSVTA
jgi:hypothetical protein